MNEVTSTRLFIIGKNGQVGRELVEYAARQGIDAVSFGSKELDVRDRAAVLSSISEHSPAVVINASAYTAVDKAEEEEAQAFAVNRDGVENLALACKALDIPLIHISTDYVFDGKKGSSYLETDQASPIGVYGASKYAGEEVLSETWEKHIILRVSWVFGIHGNNFVKTMLRVAASRPELSVVNDQLGAPTSARSIALAIFNILSARSFDRDGCAWGLYHFSGGKVVSWYDFAVEIFKRAESRQLIECAPLVHSIGTKDYPTAVERPAYSGLSGDLIAETYAITAGDWQSDLDEVLSALGQY